MIRDGSGMMAAKCSMGVDPAAPGGDFSATLIVVSPCECRYCMLDGCEDCWPRVASHDDMGYTVYCLRCGQRVRTWGTLVECVTLWNKAQNLKGT